MWCRYREKLRDATSSYSEQSRLRTGRIRVARREEKLFTKSFIYRRQIDSLSDQSVRTSQEATSASLRRRSFSTISLPSTAGLADSRTRSRFLPPRLRFLGGINNFYRPSGRRNGKRRWAFNLLRVWRVLRGFPRRKCKGGATYRNAVLLWRYRRRWRKQDDGSVKL